MEGILACVRPWQRRTSVAWRSDISCRLCAHYSFANDIEWCSLRSLSRGHSGRACSRRLLRFLNASGMALRQKCGPPRYSLWCSHLRIAYVRFMALAFFWLYAVGSWEAIWLTHRSTSLPSVAGRCAMRPRSAGQLYVGHLNDSPSSLRPIPVISGGLRSTRSP